MLNLMVDDLDGMLEQITAEGVEQLQPAETYSYGQFAWILDPDGRKIELWQPFACASRLTRLKSVVRENPSQYSRPE